MWKIVGGAVLIILLVFLWNRRIAQEIARRKQAEQALNDSHLRYQRLVEDIGPHFVLYSRRADGVLEFVSKSVEHIFGVTVDRAIGANFATFVKWLPESLAQLLNNARIMRQTGKHLSQEVRFRHLDNTIRTLLIISHPTKDENGIYNKIEGIVQDITDRKQTEAELIRALEAADAANQAKSVFLANMSHELRTPLNAVLGFSQILVNDSTLNEAQRNQAENIRRGGEYLLTLINDILDLAKIESGHFELFPEPWATHSMFQEIEYMLRVRAEQKDLYFRYETDGSLPKALYSDDRRLRQILLNLLGNAVKFTECGGVVLRSSFVNQRLCIEVQDSGIGIAADNLTKIFAPFRQTGTARYKSQGTGLGLAISRRLVDAMGGVLQVQSTLGQGSVFRVELPVQVVTDADPALPATIVTIGYKRTRGEGALRILITDDVQDNREVLRGLLEQLGFVVIEAETGEHCLDLAKAWLPDLIFMDLRMPGIDGLETTIRLRKLPNLSTVPIIVLSAAAFAEDRARSQKAGCQAHLAKPIKLPELLEVLKLYLPLEWNDKQATPVCTGPDLTSEQLENLLRMAKSGDMKSLLQYLEQMCKSPDCPKQAPVLLKLANNFQIKEIKNLLEQKVLT